MIKEQDVYKIGRVGKTHGVNGEVQVQVSDDVFDRVDSEYLILRIDGIFVPFFMEEYRFKSDEIALVTFSDIDSSQKARELTGCDVFFERERAEADEHEMTYAELVGYTLCDASNGKEVGRIAFVDEATDNILFELEDGRLLPASEELIVEIDQAEHTVALVIPEGLLDL